MVASRQSVDDINLGLRPFQPQEKRARSSSPVKQRRPTQDWSAFTRSDASLESLFSTTSLSHDQLMHFSKSDISERLHITKSDYVIPIPFQIQFPPRLTQSSAGSVFSRNSASDASPKLVFTGHSYEPVTPDMPASPVFEHNLSRPSSPVKPPSSMASRKKVSAFAKKTHSHHSDQLSMIEEKSNSGNSRASSYRSKELPTIPALVLEPPEMDYHTEVEHPKEIENHQDKAIQSPFEAQPSSSANTNSISRSLTMAHRKPPPSDDRAPGEYDTSDGQKNDAGRKEHYKSGTALSTSPARDVQKRSPDATIVSGASPEKSPDRFLPKRLPHSAAFQHNLCVASTSELKIDKRTFSDESQVSSVSSFSSCGDVLNFAHAYMSSPNAKGEVRVSKHLADYVSESKSGVGSRASSGWESSKNSDSTLEKDSAKTFEPKHSGVESHTFEFANSAFGPDTFKVVPKYMDAPNAPSSKRDVDAESPSESETAPLSISRKSTEKDSNDDALDDNTGAGIGFHFPNNTSNATNSNEAKNKTQVSRRRVRGTARNSFFSEGKIEIPDLEDSSFWQNGFSAHKKASMDSGIEPLGVPSTGAKEHLKTILGDRSFDSDSDSSFNYQFSKLQSKSAENKSIPSSKSLAAISSAKSPIRHSRHRSMYNIDFDYQSPAVAKLNHHTRSKSNANDESLSVSFAALGLDKKLPSIRKAGTLESTIPKNSNSKKPANATIAEDDEKLDIQVSEPPKRVDYAVDFKTGDAVADPAADPAPHFNTHGPSQKYYSNFKHEPHANTSPARHLPQESDSASSYRSSKTGRDTESTAPTDHDNVMIDLTGEKYDICLVSRNDSTTSYRSTIEKTRDGKNVEVVLVDEDEEYDRDDRDDLSSIYSRYMTNWGDRNRPRNPQYPTSMPTSGLARKQSTRSDASEASDASALSWAASSESNFQVKSLASIKRKQAYSKGSVLNAKGPPETIHEKASPSKIPVHSRKDASYYDYSANDAYDFKSYMSQQVQH